MEDRLTPALYLEMTDAPLQWYAAERVPHVLALPGVDRATWWRNLRRDREDVPRGTLPEFDHLGVYHPTIPRAPRRCATGPTSCTSDTSPTPLFRATP